MIDIWWRLVRFGFRLLYNELAFTYDFVSVIVSMGQWRCWQRQVLAHLPAEQTAPILELAHGTGNLQIDLNDAGYRSIGYDLSAAMGRIAQAKLKQRSIPANFARGRAQQLPFANQQFAAVVSTFPTDFIIAPETLAEVHRVLIQGGVLVIVPSAVFTGSGFIKGFLEWLYRITGQRNGETLPDIQPYFENAGFQVEILQRSCPHSQVTVVLAARQ